MNVCDITYGMYDAGGPAGEFKGHLTLNDMASRHEEVAADVVRALDDLKAKVNLVMARPLPLTYVRVPLDTQRPSRRRLQWRPLTLTDNRVSSNLELLRVLVDLKKVQQHSQNVLPLLIDEKVHYTISRMLLSGVYSPWNVGEFLGNMPLLYGAYPCSTGRLGFNTSR